MSERHYILALFLGVAALIAYLLYTNSALPVPVLTLSETDLDNVIVGDSATDTGIADGPAYMAANWHWPAPLSFWNPVNVTRQ